MSEPQGIRSPGRYVAGPEGSRAFVPVPLPPSIQWTPSLVWALSDADRAIGELAGEGRRFPELVALLEENPYWMVSGVSARLGVAYTTAQRAVQRLVDAAVLTPLTDARRNRVYCAQAVLEILEEPARLVPEI